MNLTEKDSLLYGIEFPAGSGTLHYEFELRLGTVGDNIAVFEDPAILGGGVSNMRVNAAMLARCLVSLGTIPREAITVALLDTAVDGDYDVLIAAQEMLKKKRQALRPVSETSESQLSSSGSTA